jgi:hypothetical protein
MHGFLFVYFFGKK